jgi:hypothetical protein
MIVSSGSAKDEMSEYAKAITIPTGVGLAKRMRAAPLIAIIMQVDDVNRRPNLS